MGFAIRISNALNTCYSVYLATRNSPANAERPAEKSRVVENKTNKDLDELIAEKLQLSGSKRTTIWSIFAGLILIATTARYLFTNQLPTNNCIVSTRKIDSVHWQAVVRGGDSLGKDCDVPTQMSLAADEIRAYTRDLNAEACSVSCIKQNYAGYWAAYVSINSSGGPVDGTYCGEAYSHGDCGQGSTR
jgi:hypothetical protein